MLLLTPVALLGGLLRACGRTLGEPFLVVLPGAGDAERAIGDVAGDDRARRGHRVVSDLHRGHEHTIGPRLDARADAGRVLAEAVVVRGDVAGADIRPLANVGVTNVREMGHLCPGPDARFLGLDECADLRALRKVRLGTQIGERPDLRAGADRALQHVGRDDRGPRADL